MDVDWMALHVAVDQGDLRAVRDLVEENPLRVQIRVDRMTPLFRAAGVGRLEIVRYLLDMGPDPNEKSNEHLVTEVFTPLHHAACNGHVRVVELLLTRGADAEIAAYFSRTALGQAARPA